MSKTMLKKILIISLTLVIILGVSFYFYFQQREMEYLSNLAKNYPEGEKYLSEILEAKKKLKDRNKTNDIEALNSIGVNLNILGAKEKALKYYQKTLKLNPQNLLALNNIANIYNDLGQYDLAEKYFLKLIELYPENPFFWRSIADLYRYRLNKSQKEIEDFFKQGLEKTNYHPDLITWLISYFEEIGNNEKFVEYSNLLIEKSKQ